MNDLSSGLNSSFLQAHFWIGKYWKRCPTNRPARANAPRPVSGLTSVGTRVSGHLGLPVFTRARNDVLVNSFGIRCVQHIGKARHTRE